MSCVDGVQYGLICPYKYHCLSADNSGGGTTGGRQPLSGHQSPFKILNSFDELSVYTFECHVSRLVLRNDEMMVAFDSWYFSEVLFQL